MGISWSTDGVLSSFGLFSSQCGWLLLSVHHIKTFIIATCGRYQNIGCWLDVLILLLHQLPCISLCHFCCLNAVLLLIYCNTYVAREELHSKCLKTSIITDYVLLPMNLINNNCGVYYCPLRLSSMSYTTSQQTHTMHCVYN